MLFEGYDFKRFALACRRVCPNYSGSTIRKLYSGYYYPELELYIKITETYHESYN